MAVRTLSGHLLAGLARRRYFPTIMHVSDSVLKHRPRQLPAVARRLATLLLLAWATTPAYAAAPGGQTARLCAAPGMPADAVRLRVKVTGARRVAGNITMSLYGEDGAVFLKHHGWIAQTRVTLTRPGADACFAVSSPGTYAVAVFHDENDNHRLDTNFLGLPVEGYGFSNNAAISLGPPAFAAVRFTAKPGDNAVPITLRY